MRSIQENANLEHLENDIIDIIDVTSTSNSKWLKKLKEKWIRNKIKEYTWDSFIMEKKIEIGSTKGAQIIWAWNTHLL